MSNFTYLIYAILLALLLPYVADLRAHDLTLLYSNAQQLVTMPVEVLTNAIQRGPGHGLTPSVRNALNHATKPDRGIHRSVSIRTLPRLNGILKDLRDGRILKVLLPISWL